MPPIQKSEKSAAVTEDFQTIVCPLNPQHTFVHRCRLTVCSLWARNTYRNCLGNDLPNYDLNVRELAGFKGIAVTQAETGLAYATERYQMMVLLKRLVRSQKETVSTENMAKIRQAAVQKDTPIQKPAPNWWPLNDPWLEGIPDLDYILNEENFNRLLSISPTGLVGKQSPKASSAAYKPAFDFKAFKEFILEKREEQDLEKAKSKVNADHKVKVDSKSAVAQPDNIKIQNIVESKSSRAIIKSKDPRKTKNEIHFSNKSDSSSSSADSRNSSSSKKGKNDRGNHLNTGKVQNQSSGQKVDKNKDQDKKQGSCDTLRSLFKGLNKEKSKEKSSCRK